MTPTLNSIKVGVFLFLKGGIDMLKMLYVGIGGFIGSVLRYIIAIYSTKFFGGQLPYGTLLVNVTGGIMIGIIMNLSLMTNNMSPEFRLFCTTGVMGGFTTFSAFSYETINLFNTSNYILAVINIGLNVFLSLGGVLLGQYISQCIISN